ncbi:MAG: VOC family protein [Thermoplasmata archaeon]
MSPKFTFTYTGIRVRDMDRSIAFYRGVLGMQLFDRSEMPETNGEVAALGTEGKEHALELNWYADDSPVAEPYRSGEELDHLAFAVDDLDAALAYLEKEGYTETLRQEREGAIWTFVRDPDGIHIELFQA